MVSGGGCCAGESAGNEGAIRIVRSSESFPKGGLPLPEPKSKHNEEKLIECIAVDLVHQVGIGL